MIRVRRVLIFRRTKLFPKRLLKNSFNPRPHGLGLERHNLKSIDYVPASGREAGGPDFFNNLLKERHWLEMEHRSS